MSLSRRFLYTFWLDDAEYAEYIIRYDHEAIRYSIGQLERCPTTLRYHLQSYFEFNRPVRRSFLPGLLGIPNEGYHADAAVGTAKQCRKYCSKRDTREAGPWSCGFIIQQGHRTDLDRAVATYLDRGSEECAREHATTFVRYHRGLAALAQALTPPSNNFHERTVLVRWGIPGIGKTRWAYETYPSLCRVPPPNEKSIWFDGYNGQETVLIDDYAKDSRYPYATLLQLLDGYEILVPIKGSFVVWRPSVVVITSNYGPEQWYDERHDIDALLRRITMCTMMN